ncbi:hypothetical protein ACFLV0_04880 [Chloroflexota bacterium]
MTPEVFAATTDGIEHLVLEGTLSLPVPLNEPQKRIPRRLLPGAFH